MNKFPYGQDLKKIHEWIGQKESLSNSWHIQFLGGGNTLTECQLHFLLHGLDSLTTAYAVLEGGGVSIPLGARGVVNIPRSAKDIQDTVGDEARDILNQEKDNLFLRQKLQVPFVDSVSQSSVWKSCFNLSEEKQFITRRTAHAISLADLDGSSSKVEISSTSLILFEFFAASFFLPGDEEYGLTALEVGTSELGVSVPGHSMGVYDCKWKVVEWKNNFYRRCPYRKGGQNHIFTNNRFLHYLPPYTGYLFESKEAYKGYLKVLPESYPYWQDLFPQLNESVVHFMNTEWAGPNVGGWVDELPDSYIAEFGNDL